MPATLPALNDLSPELTRDELLSRLNNALNFAGNYISHLERTAKSWNEDIDSSLDDIYSPFNRAVKAIVETSLLIFLASRVHQLPKESQVTVTTLARQLSSMARSENMQTLLMRFPHTAVTLGSAHVYLSHLGEKNEIFETLWSEALTSGQVEAVERLPYRSMDVRWLRCLAKADLPLDFEDLLPRSVLTSYANPIYMSHSDAYAVTHALMYTTDFGVQAPPASLDLAHIAAIIDSGIAWHIMSGDLDLLGELLMSAAFLRRPWSPYARFAWHKLSSTWDELGFLPGPNFNTQEYSSLTGADASEYLFRHVYHTNHVGGILCAVLLSHPESSEGTFLWSPRSQSVQGTIQRCEQVVGRAMEFCAGQNTNLLAPQEVANKSESVHSTPNQTPDGVRNHNICSSSDMKDVVTRAVEHLGSCSSPEANWAQVLKEAPLTEEELALVLFDGVLIQAARQYDLALLAGALADVSHTSLRPSATFLDAVNFLARQQLHSGAIGAHFTIEENRNSSSAPAVTTALAATLALAVRHLDTFAPTMTPVSRLGASLNPSRCTKADY